VGVQQSVGRWVVADLGYFTKRTQNAYDFNVLFNTPIFFPVAWDHYLLMAAPGLIAIADPRSA
jgi:hypothetical protein